ncbi:MAG: hypothetical protein SFW67_28390 [Myxococcaceae bacterium]|nr:hypothetical protein [Myxococcaceae bacterium]
MEDLSYFAARTGTDLAKAILEKKTLYERFVESSGLLRIWRLMHWRYFGANPETGNTNHEVNRAGAEGELHLLDMNHLRADVTLWLTLAFSQRTEMEPQVAVDDYEAELEVRRARAILSYFGEQAGIEEAEKLAGEFAGVYGVGYILRLWDRTRGELTQAPIEADPAAGLEQGAPEMRTGGMEGHALTPMDVFHDCHSRSMLRRWNIVRLYKPRHDLAVKYPQHAERIINASADEGKDTLNHVDIMKIARFGDGRSARDEVPVYYFFHEDSPAVPGGKFAVILDGETVLEEERLDATYRTMPVKRLVAAEIHRTPFGFSPAWGLLAPQEAQQSLSTIGLSNARTFGLGIIVSPKGADVDHQSVADGLKLVEYTPGLEAPKPLQMPQTPAEVYAFRNALISEMGTLVGVNSVVRGDPEASLKSGSALALVQAQAVQFSNDFQANIVVWKEKHHMDTITIAQMNMSEQLEPQIAGDYAAALLKPFSGKDFKRVKRVKMKGVNPMSRTLAGKVQIADTLVERFSNVLTPGDYMRVIETGSVDYLTRGETQRRKMLDRENELLAAGFGPPPPAPVDPMTGQPLPAPPMPKGVKYVSALITDDHRAHVIKHLEVLDNPALREGTSADAQRVVDAVLSHIEEHEQLAILATQTRMALLELTNQPPLQSALPLPPPPAGADAGGGDSSKGPPSPSSAGEPAKQPTPAGGGELPRQPQMPVNPSTGQRVEEVPGPV